MCQLTSRGFEMLKVAFSFVVGLFLVGGYAHAQTSVCPFKAEELKAALGVDFEPGKPGKELKAGTVVANECRYDGKKFTVRVGQEKYTPPLKDAKAARQASAGKFVPIPNDPDEAAFQEGQGDNTSPTVHYYRNGTSVSLRVLGVWWNNSSTREKEMIALREKLAKLRRFP
jgi:hypothetical protein